MCRTYVPPPPLETDVTASGLHDWMLDVPLLARIRENPPLAMTDLTADAMFASMCTLGE